jgi:hypothetical protein
VHDFIDDVLLRLARVGEPEVVTLQIAVIVFSWIKYPNADLDFALLTVIFVPDL